MLTIVVNYAIAFGGTGVAVLCGSMLFQAWLGRVQTPEACAVTGTKQHDNQSAH